MREMKEAIERRGEEIKEQRKEIQSLKRKVIRLEQSAGKRKRDGSEESRGGSEKRKWWAERDSDERRRKNVIIRIEEDRWTGRGTNWEKVKKLFTEGLKIGVEVREVNVIGQRGNWVTVLVKLGSEEDKWRVLEARRREGSRMRVKMDKDKSVESRRREKEEKKGEKKGKRRIGGGREERRTRRS